MVRLYVLGVLGAFASLFATNAFAKDVDLSTRTEVSGEEFFVGVCARPSPAGTVLADGKPGHMFASFSHKFPDGTFDFVALGHTTDAGAAALVTYFPGGGVVDGRIEAEKFTHALQECLNVKVNPEDYRAASQALSVWRTMEELTGVPLILEDYTLGSEDCMSFALDVAAKLEPLGLIVPVRDGTELPMDYLARLIAAN